MAKIDFKLSEDKKALIQQYAREKGISMSAVINGWVDEWIEKNQVGSTKQEKSIHIIHALETSKRINDEKIRAEIQNDLEGLLCQM